MLGPVSGVRTSLGACVDRLYSCTLRSGKTARPINVRRRYVAVSRRLPYPNCHLCDPVGPAHRPAVEARGRLRPPWDDRNTSPIPPERHCRLCRCPRHLVAGADLRTTRLALGSEVARHGRRGGAQHRAYRLACSPRPWGRAEHVDPVDRRALPECSVRGSRRRQDVHVHLRRHVARAERRVQRRVPLRSAQRRGECRSDAARGDVGVVRGGLLLFRTRATVHLRHLRGARRLQAHRRLHRGLSVPVPGGAVGDGGVAGTGDRPRLEPAVARRVRRDLPARLDDHPRCQLPEVHLQAVSRARLSRSGQTRHDYGRQTHDPVQRVLGGGPAHELHRRDPRGARHGACHRPLH